MTEMEKRNPEPPAYDPAHAGYDQPVAAPAYDRTHAGYDQGPQMTQPVAAPGQIGVQVTGVYSANMAPMIVAPDDPDINRLKNYNIVVIVLSFIATLLLCNWVFGIPAVILAFLGREDYMYGRKDAGKTKTAIALALSLVAILIVIGIIIYAVVWVVNAQNQFAKTWDTASKNKFY